MRKSFIETCPYCGVKLEKIPKRKKICSECGNYIFVRQGKLYTEKEREEEIERHKKIPPRHKAEYVYTPGKTQLTEKDIDEAFRTWDKIMPEYEGLLDADIEKGNDD